MESKTDDLFKGEQMEELLRLYFLDLGYYVIRGSKLRFHEVEVTDVDLWLYHRSNPISRERINVDIKNKVRPMAIERIIVAKGIMDILGFDRCIVATSDKRDEVIEFGEKRGVTVLNGNFLNKIKSLTSQRLSEEKLNSLLKDEFTKFTTNWYLKNESAKSGILENLDFVGANSLLIDIKEILIQFHSTPLKREGLTRLLYLFVSYILITVDFILKDMAFIEASAKNKHLEDGFRYGITGKTKIKIRIEQMATASNRSPQSIIGAVETLPVDILRDFFGKNDNAKNLFKLAKEFENYAYLNSLTKPLDLPPELKGVIGLLCDFSGIDRKMIFG
ncbi:hypothetical protein [Chitinophaga silvisoli]|uniref:Uncharacterized protein n=1 Tax=Chitinophaga silvisoli TaxID=2291814 RepID=A0A3E1PA23_9BACT|nr:hypothetical protein [Chitinophaga silvisoli]RFM37042.1 hypothetical protein DXN04_05965 [Chitinophaga silvisoli]